MDGLGCFTTLSLHHCAVRKHAVIVKRHSVVLYGIRVVRYRPVAAACGDGACCSSCRTPMSQPDVDVRWQMKQVLKSGAKHRNRSAAGKAISGWGPPSDA